MPLPESPYPNHDPCIGEARKNASGQAHFKHDFWIVSEKGLPNPGADWSVIQLVREEPNQSSIAIDLLQKI
jgi:hypothetical protein